MDTFNTTINNILIEDWKSATAAGILGLGAFTGLPNVNASESSHINQSHDSFLNAAFDYIKSNEGLKLQPYLDTNKIPTIGIGHKILPNEDFSDGITKEMAIRMFYKDVQQKVVVAKRLFPNFDKYPEYLKVALLDGVYRGDHKNTYKTTKLINSGQFINAATEYLKHNDYYKSKQKNSGVWKRMEKNSNAMKRFGMEQND